MRYLLQIFISLTIILITAFVFLITYPFYEWEQPFRVKGDNFRQGEYVTVYTTRDSRIDTKVDAVRELIHIVDDKYEHEVQKVFYTVAFDKGKKTIAVNFRIPPEEVMPLKPGIYRWSGTCTYKVWWVERTIHFDTETFNIVG